MRRCAGTVSFIRQFLRHADLKLDAIWQAMKQGKADKAAVEAWRKIKDELKDQRNLAIPVAGEPFEVYTDGSDVGMGAVLTQGGNSSHLQARNGDRRNNETTTRSTRNYKQSTLQGNNGATC